MHLFAAGSRGGPINAGVVPEMAFIPPIKQVPWHLGTWELDRTVAARDAGLIWIPNKTFFCSAELITGDDRRLPAIVSLSTPAGSLNGPV